MFGFGRKWKLVRRCGKIRSGMAFIEQIERKLVRRKAKKDRKEKKF